jgi:PleD family two-component response regulator
VTLSTRSPILRILIVDDEAFICSTVKQMLKAIGTYDVKDARDGATPSVSSSGSSRISCCATSAWRR